MRRAVINIIHMIMIVTIMMIIRFQWQLYTRWAPVIIFDRVALDCPKVKCDTPGELISCDVRVGSRAHAAKIAGSLQRLRPALGACDHGVRRAGGLLWSGRV